MLERKTKYEGRNCETYSRTKAQNAANNVKVHLRRSSRDRRKDIEGEAIRQ